MTTIMADHSHRRRKCPPNAPHEELRPMSSSLLDGRKTSEQADTIFKRLRGCMALITFRCYGNASSPEQRSALRAIHPLNTHYILLLGGLLPINLTRWNEAQCLVWGIRGAFPPAATMVVTVFCSLPEHEPLFPVNQGIVGIARKLLSRARQFLHCTAAEM